MEFLQVGWESSPDSFRLRIGEVHLWAWQLREEESAFGLLEGFLSEDERGRRQRFRFMEDRSRFTISRGNLRRLLGRYLSSSPSEIQFTYNRYGKPCLEEKHGAIEFNLSHTKEIAVAAFAHGSPLGIDVEHVQPIEIGVAEHVFSAGEMRVLSALDSEQKLLGFYNCWTRKEAICKAEGRGFSLAASEFSVSLRPSEEACIESTGGVLSRIWHLIDLPIGGDVLGTLAVSAVPSELRCFRLH